MSRTYRTLATIEAIEGSTLVCIVSGIVDEHARARIDISDMPVSMQSPLLYQTFFATVTAADESHPVIDKVEEGWAITDSFLGL